MKHILPATFCRESASCLSAVYALMVYWQLGVRMVRPGPFYTGTSCLLHVNKCACPFFFFKRAESFIIMFFLYLVIACPGVPACSGRGICSDTISGNGSCTCEVRMEQLLVMSVKSRRERLIYSCYIEQELHINFDRIMCMVESWLTLDQHLD